MKKSLLILGLIAILGLGASSCKKNCKCKTTVYGETIEQDLGKTKKKDCPSTSTYTYTDYDYEWGYTTETITLSCSWN